MDTRIVALVMVGCGGTTPATPTDASVELAPPILMVVDATRAPVDAIAPPPVARRRGQAPCFPERATVTARWLADQIAAGRRGTCSLEVRDPEAVYPAAVVLSADGAEVMTMHCGLEVKARRIHDHRGLGVGVRGHTVLAAYADPSDRLSCLPMWQPVPRVRCQMPWRDEEPRWSYVVEGTIDEPILTGAAAVALFSPRRVVELFDRGSCH